MASPTLLTFDAEGQAVAFDVWLDDLQLFLQCDSRDGLSLFDLTLGASTAPAADADSTVRSQWLTRDAAARLAVRSHLPPTKHAHFSKYKSAKTLYDAVVARYSSPATAALSRLMLPYLFSDLAAFATVTDLITHLRTSDTRYRAALPAEDHFLSLCPTTLTVDLLEERLLAAETSITAVGASRGDPRTPFFEGCSRVPLLLSVASAAAVDLVGTESVSAASAPSERRRISKAKRGKGAGGGSGGGGSGGGGARGGGGGVVAEVGASVAAVELEAEAAVAGGVVEAEEAAEEVEPAEAELCNGEPSRSSAFVRPLHPSSFVSGTRGARGLECAHFPDATEIPRWYDLLGSGVAIFDLDFDAILAAMYAVSISAEGDCYVCVPPDPGIEAAALGASESAAPGARESAALGAGESALSGTASAQVFHTFTLDSGASRSFFRDRTTLTPLSRPVAVSLADPSGGPVLASYSTGPAPSGVSQVDAFEPVEVAADSGASRGPEPGCAESGGAEPGGAEPGGAEPGGDGSGGAEPGGAEPGGAGSGGAEPERAEPGGAASGGAEPGAAESGGVEHAGSGPGGPSGALSRRELPSPQELREWFARCWSRAAGAGGAASAGGSAATGGTGAGGATGAGAGGSTSAGGSGATGPGGACTGGPGAAGPAGAPGVGAGGAAGVGATEGTGTGGATGVGADAGGAGVVPAGSRGAARPRPYFVPLLEQVLGLPSSSGPAPPLECPPPVQSESQLQLASPLPTPSPYASPTGGLAERREPESRPASPVRTARTSRRVPRPRPPEVPGTHQMTLRPSTAPQRVPLPSPPESSLPALADPASDSLRATSPTVTRLLTTVVTDPSFESTAASALVAELVDFAAACRLDFATRLVADSMSASVYPPSVGGECALSTDVLEDRQEEFQCFAAALPHLVSMLLAPEGDPDAPDILTTRSYAEAIEGPYSSQWQAAMDAKMASWKSTGTYVDEVPPPGANIVSGMWVFRVKRPAGSPPVFKARYVARGFSQRQGVE
ncbi:unnamed protein product [Closterium sp. NIES-54]